MAEQSSHSLSVNCNDFNLFQDVLREMRKFEDRLVNVLNTSVPTRSFSGKVNAAEQCKSLFAELLQAHGQRDLVIKKCVAERSLVVESLHKQRQADIDNLDIHKKLRQEQHKLRQMQSEIYVEEIVKDRSIKVFRERCRTHYLPPDMDT